MGIFRCGSRIFARRSHSRVAMGAASRSDFTAFRISESLRRSRRFQSVLPLLLFCVAINDVPVQLRFGSGGLTGADDPSACSSPAVNDGDLMRAHLTIGDRAWLVIGEALV